VEKNTRARKKDREEDTRAKEKEPEEEVEKTTRARNVTPGVSLQVYPVKVVSVLNSGLLRRAMN
jgi:hypothetical protein